MSRGNPDYSGNVLLIPPTTDPMADPLICVSANQDWIPYLLGQIEQLTRPLTWLVHTEDELADINGRVSDLLGVWGSAGVCVSIQIRLTDTCTLQESADSGATWTDVTGWVANFTACIEHVLRGSTFGKPLMTDGVTFPPVPVYNDTGDDWIYSG